MIETALVFNLEGQTMLWHEPHGRSGGSIPDSADLWNFLWENRHRLGGVAHTHPWFGAPWPSETDLTTFRAIDAALGRPLLWVVATLDNESYWGLDDLSGPENYGYRLIRDPDVIVRDLQELRRRST